METLKLLNHEFRKYTREVLKFELEMYVESTFKFI